MTLDDREHTLLMGIAAQLELRRLEREAKLYVMALEAQMSANTVRRILQGRDHHVSNLIALADALGCDVVVEIKPRKIA